MKHKVIEYGNNCKLYHENAMCDYINHVFQEYSEYFNNADLILIERQPPMGLIVIQELIMNKYREKIQAYISIQYA